jgi:hypothetical protein
MKKFLLKYVNVSTVQIQKKIEETARRMMQQRIVGASELALGNSELKTA